MAAAWLFRSYHHLLVVPQSVADAYNVPRKAMSKDGHMFIDAPGGDSLTGSPELVSRLAGSRSSSPSRSPTMTPTLIMTPADEAATAHAGGDYELVHRGRQQTSSPDAMEKGEGHGHGQAHESRHGSGHEHRSHSGDHHGVRHHTVHHHHSGHVYSHDHHYRSDSHHAHHQHSDSQHRNSDHHSSTVTGATVVASGPAVAGSSQANVASGTATRDPSTTPEFDNEKLRPPSRSSVGTRRTNRSRTTVSSFLSFSSLFRKAPKLWKRFRGKNRDIPSIVESARNTAMSSILNILLIFIPFAWASHFHWKNDNLTFALCFLGIIPLENLFDFGGEQMGYYVGRELGELVIITMNNTVEATLAIILLKKCELRILQATIVGVVLLHLLLLPGTAFLTGGARIWEQNLHPHPTQLNASLLTIGVLTILIPTAFFAALDNGVTADGLVSDETRSMFLQMSHGLAVILLLVYIMSRIFLHNPPGDGNALQPAPGAPVEIHLEEARLLEERPKVTSGFCLLLLLATIAVLAVTAEMLVESIEHVREDGNIQEEWFGLILLPIVSFSADGVVAILYFVRAALFLAPEPPATLAKARAIDLSVQFTLFWMPFLVLLGWWLGKPLILLFDLFEVAVTLGAIFLVNYVTADSKTNWAEGFILVAFYFMIALCTWFYGGQTTVEEMLSCGSIAEALATAAAGGAGE